MRNTLNRTQTPTLAAHLAGEAITPLWVSPSGRAFFPIAGGAPDDPPKQDDPPKDPPKQDDPPKTFEPITSQEQLDRVLSGRLAREREKYADYDELKKSKDELDKLRADSQTEQEKAVAAAKAEGQAAERERTNSLLVKARAATLAAQERFKAPDLVVASLDLSGVKVDDNGVVDDEALQAKINAAKETGAFVIDDGKPNNPKPDHSQGGGGGDPKTKTVAGGKEMFAASRGKKSD